MSEKVYLCDKKKGACSSWRISNWKKCPYNPNNCNWCNHTTNPDHALCYGCDGPTSTHNLLLKCVRCKDRKEIQDDRE